MKYAKVAIGVGALALVGYLVYRKMRDARIAAAHPIQIQPDNKLLQPVKVDASLVTDAVVIPS